MLRKHLSFVLLSVFVLQLFAPFGPLIQSVSAAPATNVIISEVEYDVTGTESEGEWIELYNPTNAAVSLSGWTLTEGGGSVYTFGGVSIDAFSYLVVGNDSTEFSLEHSGKTLDIDMQKTDAAGCFSDGECLRLNNTSDSLVLADDNAVTVDTVEWGAGAWTSLSATAGNSICRIGIDDTDTAADWISDCTPTPGTGRPRINYDGIFHKYQVDQLNTSNKQHKVFGFRDERDILFGDSGTKLYIVRPTTIDEHNLSIPYDAFSNTYVTSISTGTETNALSMTFNNTGTKMYLLGAALREIHQYSLTTPYSLSTATFDNVVASITAGPNLETYPNGIEFSPDGMKLFIIGTLRDQIRQYTLPAPYDFTNAVYDNKFLPAIGENNPQDLVFSSDGMKLFFVGSGQPTDRIRQYNLTSPFDLGGGASFMGESPAVSSRAHGVAFNYYGNSAYVVGTNSISVTRINSFEKVNGFSETSSNGGEVQGDFSMQLQGANFSHTGGQTILEYGTDYTLPNLPAGFTPILTLQTDSGLAPVSPNTATIGVMTLSGSALNHELANNITGLQIQFNDSAFALTNAHDVINSGSPSLYNTNTNISFIDNNAPSNISLTPNRIPDGTGPGIVGTIKAIDSDVANTLTYSFATGTGDTDNALFTLNPTTAELSSTFTANIATKGTYNIRVQVSDGIDDVEKMLTITIGDLGGPVGINNNISLWLKADVGVVGTTNVSEWNDQSGNGFDLAQSSSANQPDLLENSLNFNPTINFDGGTDTSQQTLFGNLGNFSGDQSYNIYSVFKEDILTAGSNVFSIGDVENQRATIAYHPSLGGGGTDKYLYHFFHDYDTGFPSIANKWYIDSFSYKSGQAGNNNIVRSNAQEIGSGFSASSLVIPSNPIVSVGGYSNRPGAVAMDGQIAEFIVYSDKNSDEDNAIIESYLALKYGITLSGTGYVNTAGGSVYNLAADTNYQSHVVGLAKDGELDQRISKSQEGGSVLTITTDDIVSDFTSANGGTRTQMTDGEYIVLASDNGAANAPPTSVTGYSNKVARQWRAEVTNYTGDVNVKFDIPAISGIDWDLVQSDTSDFSTSTTLTKVADLDTNGEALDVMFTDGKYYGLMKVGVPVVFSGPANIDTNVALWLRADTGVTGTTNVSQWDDQSGQGNNVSQTTASKQPDLVENSLNFNPTINFEGGVQPAEEVLTGNIASNFDGNQSHSVYVVFNEESEVNESNAFAIGIPFGTYSQNIAYHPNNFGGNSDTKFFYYFGNDYDTSIAATSGQWSIDSLHYDSSIGVGIDTTASINGQLPVGKDSGNLNIPTNPIVSVGGYSNRGGARALDGKIAEFIVYADNNSATDRQKIESYLALKYGITLNSSIGNYLNTASSSVYDYTVDTNYQSYIVGIAKDQELDQRVSKSQETGSVLILTTDDAVSDFTSANGGSRTQMADGEYVILGSDNGALTSSTTSITGYSNKIARQWRAEVTNYTGDVNVKFDIPALSGTDWDLVQSDTSDFSTSTTLTKVADLDTNGEVLDVTFTDGKYYGVMETSAALVNAIPTDISLSSSSINENVGTGSTVGLLSTTDSDSGDSHSYSFATGTGDTDNGSFTLSGASLNINLSPDYETKSSYSVRIQTDDGNGGTFQKVLSISITDLDEIAPSAPTANTPSDFSPLTGMGEVGSTITVLSSSGTVIGTGAVTGTGTFSITLSSIPTTFPVQITATDAAGNTSSSTDITESITDLDGDGISNTMEDASPNNGDTNGDGTLDSMQSFVSSAPNPNVGGGAHVTLQTDNLGCNFIRKNQLVSDPGTDSGYRYPIGLLDFQIECTNAGESTELTIFYDKLYNTSSWVYRKQDGASFRTLPGVTFGTHTYASGPLSGTTVTTAVFTVQDGNTVTDDDLVEKFITDPSGPAVHIRSTGGSGQDPVFSCGDKNALNYNPEGFSDLSLCKYDSNVPASTVVISKNTENHLEKSLEKNTLEESKILVKGEDYTLENSFSTCPVVKNLQNPSYTYLQDAYTDISASPYKNEILKYTQIGVIQGYGDGIFAPEKIMTRSEFLKIMLKTHCYDYGEYSVESIDYQDVDKKSWQAKVIAKAEDLGMIDGDLLEINKDLIDTNLEKQYSLERISELKRVLRGLGLYKGQVDGYYTQDLVETIFDFQVANGIIKNQYQKGAGSWGPETRKIFFQKYPKTTYKVFRPNDFISKIEATKILMRLSSIKSHNSIEIGYVDIEIPWQVKYITTGEALGIFNSQKDAGKFHPLSGVKREEVIHMTHQLVEMY